MPLLVNINSFYFLFFIIFGGKIKKKMSGKKSLGSSFLYDPQKPM